MTLPALILALTLSLHGAMVPDGDREDTPPLAVSLVSRWAAAPRTDVTPAAGYAWPTGSPTVVLRSFAGPAVPWATGHRGVDLALAPGAPVYAAAAGVVAFAGRVADRSVVSIVHVDGIRTTYEPLEPAVRTGDLVERGHLVGTLAPGHCPDGCLHFGARRGEDDYLDPMSLLRPVVIRLLPDR